MSYRPIGFLARSLARGLVFQAVIFVLGRLDGHKNLRQLEF